MKEKPLNLTATPYGEAAYANADFVVVCTPTDSDPATNYFNTTSVEGEFKQVIAVNQHAVIVIKSTVPVNYTEGLAKKLGCKSLLFSRISA